MNNTYQLTTHRVNYACPVERPEPLTWRDWATVAAFWLAGAALFVAGFMVGRYALHWLASVDWAAVLELLGSKQ